MSRPTTALGVARRVRSRPHRPVPDLISARPVRLSELTGPEAEGMLEWLGANGCPRIALSLHWEPGPASSPGCSARFCLEFCWGGVTHRGGGR